MKPEYKMIYNRCSSLLDAEQNLQVFRKTLSSFIDGSSFGKRIINSTIPLIVTLITNPTVEEISGFEESAPGVFFKTTSEFEGDTSLYALRLKFNKLELPKVFDAVLVYFSTRDYLQNESQRNFPQEEDATPVFTAVDPMFTYDEIILTPDIRRRLERASAIVKNRELIFEKWGFKKIDKSTKSIILFYGSAGTGKTMTAHAVASYLGKKIMISSYAQIESKWVGEGPKNLRAIFNAAKEQDAVLFMDEADSFLSNRISDTSSGSDKHYNRMSNELFQLLENFDGCVIFATNLISDVDGAFKSRIVDSILFPLPDFEGRIAIIKHMMPTGIEFFPKLSDEDIKNLANDIEGFSGRDIRKSVLLALADASIAASENPGVYRFTLETFRNGFMEVKQYKEEMEREVNNGALIDAVQEVVDKQKFSEKALQIAQYVSYADGVVEPEEQKLLDELSKTFDVEIPKWEDTQKLSMTDICQGLNSAEEKSKLLNVACRMATADNRIPDCETELIKDLYTNLGYDLNRFDNVASYLERLLVCNNMWQTVLNG